MTNDDNFTLGQGVGKFCVGGVVQILEAEKNHLEYKKVEHWNKLFGRLGNSVSKGF